MGWGLWVHTDDMTEESMPALLDDVAYVRKACAAYDFCVFDFVEPAYTEDAPLAAHVDSLQVV